MKSLFSSSLLILFLALLSFQNSYAVRPKQGNVTVTISDVNADRMKSLDKTQLEKQLGRKLKFKEKVALWLLKRKINKNSKYGEPSNEKKKMDEASIISFLSGLVCMGGTSISAFFPWEFFGIVAIILGIIGLVRTRKNPDLRGKGLATVGLVVGSIFLLIPLLIGV